LPSREQGSEQLLLDLVDLRQPVVQLPIGERGGVRHRIVDRQRAAAHGVGGVRRELFRDRFGRQLRRIGLQHVSLDLVLEIVGIEAKLDVDAEHEGAGAVELALQAEIPGIQHLGAAGVEHADNADRAAILVEIGPGIGRVVGADPDLAGRVRRGTDHGTQSRRTQARHFSPDISSA
jgi:hypothetical protein